MPDETKKTAWSSDRAPDVRLTIARSVEDLRACGRTYEDFLHSIPDGRGLFCMPDWLDCYAPVYTTRSKRMYFLLAWRGPHLIGLAPFQIERKSVERAGLRRLYFWGGLTGYPQIEGDFLIAAPSDTEPCMRAFANLILDPANDEIDFVDLGYFRGRSLGYDAVLRHFDPDRRELDDMCSYRIDLPASFDAYRASIKKSTLSLVEKRTRAFERTHRVELACTPRLSDEDLVQAMALHQKRQDELMRHGRARFTLFGEEKTRTQYLRLLDVGARNGWARHYLLKADGRLVAYNFCFRFARTLFCHTTAFDSDFNKFSPGRSKLLQMVRAEIESKDTDCLDLLMGKTEVKDDFCNGIDQTWRLQTVKRNSLRSRAKYLAWRTLAGAHGWLTRRLAPV